MNIKVYYVVDCEIFETQFTPEEKIYTTKVIKAEDFLNAIKDVEKEIDEYKQSEKHPDDNFKVWAMEFNKGLQKAKSILSKLKEEVKWEKTNGERK